jgi:hypothetical protein
MPTSPSQAKVARSKEPKSNASNGRAAPPETRSAASAATRPSEEAIAQRAYEIYEREGRQDGRDLENWLKAEAELTGAKGH